MSVPDLPNTQHNTFEGVSINSTTKITMRAGLRESSITPGRTYLVAEKKTSKLSAARPAARQISTATSKCMVDRSGLKEKVVRICGPSGSITGKSGEQCCRCNGTSQRAG